MIMSLILHECIHIFLGLFIGFFVCVVFQVRKKLAFMLSSVALSLFFDADHLFDYGMYYGFWHFDFQDFFSGRYFVLHQKMYIFFHSIEFVMSSVILSFLLNKKYKRYFILFAFSLLLHVSYDAWFYKISFLKYFITYRYINGFSL